MIRVLLADDDTLLCRSLSILLDAEEDVEVVAAVGDGSRAVAAARSLRPDVVLMDVRMPGMDGTAAARALRATPPQPAPRILMMTMHDEESPLEEALALGVDGFLLKDSPPDQLLEAIRAVAAGRRVLGEGPLGHVIRGYLRAGTRPADDPLPGIADSLPPAEAPGRTAGLTPREREVLALIAEGRSNAEIQQALFISRGTLKTHISALLRKTGSRDRSALIVLSHTSRHCT